MVGIVNRPNLLMIVSEGIPTTIATRGNGIIRTPNLDRLAREGMVFENAYCTQPSCTPARATLFTGQYPHAVGCPDNEHNLPAGKPCFLELADFPDYRTAHLGKLYLGDEVFAQHGFQEWKSVDSTCKVAYSPGRDPSEETSYERFLIKHGLKPDVPSSRRSSDPHSWFSGSVTIPERLGPDAYLGGEAIEFIRSAGKDPLIMWLNFLRCKPDAFDPTDQIYDSWEVPLSANFDASMG